MHRPVAAPPLAEKHPPASLANLQRFLDEVGHQTSVAPRTLSAYRLAVASFTRELGLADTTDLCTLDMDAAIRRYRNATRDVYTKHSVNTYVSHARRAIGLFVDWVDSGFNWQTVDVGQAAVRKPSSDEWYRFPLRTDLVVTFRLPRDLTTTEAARLTAFITALPMHHDEGAETTPS